MKENSRTEKSEKKVYKGEEIINRVFPLTQKIREALQLDSYHDDDCFLQFLFLFLSFLAERERAGKRKKERKKKKEKEGENLSRHENPEIIFFLVS